MGAKFQTIVARVGNQVATYPCYNPMAVFFLIYVRGTNSFLGIMTVSHMNNIEQSHDAGGWDDICALSRYQYLGWDIVALEYFALMR